MRDVAHSIDAGPTLGKKLGVLMVLMVAGGASLASPVGGILLTREVLRYFVGGRIGARGFVYLGAVVGLVGCLQFNGWSPGALFLNKALFKSRPAPSTQVEISGASR